MQKQQLPSNDFIAQMGHAGWGALIVLAFALYGHPLWGALGVLAWAVPKEFAYDAIIEGQSLAENAHDFLFYQVGNACGLIFAFIHAWWR